jgi:hypothetical protein
MSIEDNTNCVECGNAFELHSLDRRCPKNGGYQINGKLEFFATHFEPEISETDQLRARITELEAENARLTAANELMQEDAVQNTYAFNLMLTANKDQAAEIEQIKEQVQETLDLLRTGCAPDAFNMDEKQWMSHKINRAANFLSAMLRGKK